MRVQTVSNTSQVNDGCRADDVSGIGFEIRGDSTAVWIETSRGLSRILFEPITFEEKARRFEERIRTRHVRHGLTATFSSNSSRRSQFESNCIERQ